MSHTLHLNRLTLAELRSQFEDRKPLVLSKEATEKIEKGYSYLQNRLSAGGEPIYGVNTGFGALCNTIISPENLSDLQLNLLRSHACGTGEEAPSEIVRLMLALKARSLSYGHSGVHLDTVQRLLDFYNAGVTPVVYTLGSLGASGDLAPLAHLCLPLVGEGWVKDGEKKLPAQTLSLRYGWRPLKLRPKEGLALLNGTQFMSAFGVWLAWEARRLSDWSLAVSAMSLSAFGGRIEPFHPLLQQVRPHAGQIEVAAAIRSLLQDSPHLTSGGLAVQDPYSFRCIPQVHGATLDTLRFAETTIETEINSVTDNPNLFPDDDLILSGGNFHGQAIAQALDYLAISFAQLGAISERRVYHLLAGNRGLPAFLAADPGLHSGFMILQYTAASVVNRMKHDAAPNSLDSIPSSNGQEDYVSMGANAAVKCARVLDNVKTLLAIELMHAAQALYLLNRQPSPLLQKLLADFRALVPPADKDRVFAEDLENARRFIGQYSL